ncbi:MAG: rubrerythrin [Alphaproteobacteria bacterium]|nr:rubrerythrin [Alphaproteobacteria bacterium]
MPEFAKLDSIYTPEKYMTSVEILRAIKFAIASEFEAIQIYQQIMDSTDNKIIHNVLGEITDDEKKHAGGLYKLLEILSPEDEEQYQLGVQETIENIAK